MAVSQDVVARILLAASIATITKAREAWEIANRKILPTRGYTIRKQLSRIKSTCRDIFTTKTARMTNHDPNNVEPLYDFQRVFMLA